MFPISFYKYAFYDNLCKDKSEDNVFINNI